MAALILGVGAFVAMLRFKVGMLPVLGVSMVVGAAIYLLTH